MRNTDNEILKKTLLHYINLEYYANSLDEEFQTLLNELQARCRDAIESQKTISTKASYTAVYRIIKEEVDKFQKELEERLEEQAELIMNQETEFLDGLYNKPVEEGEGNVIKTAALAFSGVTLSKVLFSPIDGRDTAKQFAERTGKNILRSYDTPLRSGYLFGQKSEEVTAQVSNQMKQVARGMQSGILTAIPSFAKTTDRIVFLNNNVEVVWCAVLDGRGCITCYSLNGLHFKSVSLAPAIPHNRCRCVLCPAKDITEPLPTYEEYIESLSEDDQLHILGRNRYDLWKNYGIELKQFVNNGRKLRLDEIDTAKSFSFSSEKSQEILDKQQKVNPQKLKKVIAGLAKNGYEVKMGDEIDRYLNAMGREAAIYGVSEGKPFVMYHSKLSASGMFEEIIHLSQIRKYGIEKARALYNELEIEAKEKLLKFAESYGITEYEQDVIQNMLDFHKKQIGRE